MFGAFDKILLKALFGLVIELFSILSSTNQYFFTLYMLVQYFITDITSDDGKKYIDDDGSAFFSKNKVRKRYNEKYQNTYANC